MKMYLLYVQRFFFARLYNTPKGELLFLCCVHFFTFSWVLGRSRIPFEIFYLCSLRSPSALWLVHDNNMEWGAQLTLNFFNSNSSFFVLFKYLRIPLFMNGFFRDQLVYLGEVALPQFYWEICCWVNSWSHKIVGEIGDKGQMLKRLINYIRKIIFPTFRLTHLEKG